MRLHASMQNSTDVRQIVRGGEPWIVRELDSRRVPGARGEFCLIFECDGIVRRVWQYGSDWAALSDDELWALLEQADDTARATREGLRAGQAASAVTERTRSLLMQVELIRKANQALRTEQRELLERCAALRSEMRAAVASYAESLRAGGVPPEQAVVLLKRALQKGVAAGDDIDESAAEQVVHEGVDWAIDAYYTT